MFGNNVKDGNNKGIELERDWQREPLIGQLHRLIRIGVRVLVF